ncbi:MAG: 2-C-methyl-D-erythritol 4-phosphate cytidylyltransferase [Bacteroidales bacterium]|nr:2-C-methyl-D-erythritol 4-phosphate cytidylyltransferase [Bacteroidales bacterium]
MTHYAIIVAGGSGTRFGSQIPKQFLPLAGKPVLMHTIERFARCPGTQVVLVLPQAQQDYWQSLCAEHGFDVPHSVVNGGDSRFQSVKNGLLSLSLAEDDIVAVHDGVRPLVSQALIAATFQAAKQFGGAIPATPVTDSVRQLLPEGGSVALDRASLRAVQTPQTFRALELLRAYDVPFEPFFTDDASVYEHAGGHVALVTGETTNIKITHPIDITIAEHIIASQS